MSDAEPVIACNDVHKSFGSLHVLRGVSLSVTRGETVVVLGRSGTGKSVLLKSIIGLLDPDRGRIEVAGRSFADMPERQRLRYRSELGYVFQGAALFDSLTVLENVGFALNQKKMPVAEIRERVATRLDMVGLKHAIDEFPSELSGGMQKRVGLARALVEEPSIILYDEPTSGLDPLTTDVINQIILRLRNRLSVTSVVVTHDIKSAFTIADRIIMLDQGRIVAQGTPAEIEHCDNKWVQHFIAGQALESEVVSETGSIRHRTGESGLRPVVTTRPESNPALETILGSSGMRAPIRKRKKSFTHRVPAQRESEPTDQRP
jgi:phospholipid/cholesterol/gamma-HCH transport system ATP-binding protein